jgi:hypothetical protein
MILVFTSFYNKKSLILAFKYDFIKIVIDLDLLKCYNEEVKNKKRGGSKSKRRGSKSK